MGNHASFNVVNLHIYYLVSQQIEREFAAHTELAEDIGFAIMLASPDPAEEVTIYEWYLVSEDFAYQAEIAGEVIVVTPFGLIWGRQTTGLALEYDATVNGILAAIPSR